MIEQTLLTIEMIREKEYKIGDVLSVKPYLSLTTKKIIIKKILDLCITEEESIKKIDFALKEFAYGYILSDQYSNINFEVEDVLELYDELKENDIIDIVLKAIPESEINFIDYVLRKEIEQIQLVDNSLASVVSKSLNKIMEKIPDQKGIAKLIKELPKQFNKLDSSKLKYLTDAIGWNKGKENA